MNNYGFRNILIEFLDIEGYVEIVLRFVFREEVFEFVRSALREKNRKEFWRA